jgi:hypothetical protein
VAMVELCTHLADRKGKDGNPPPTAGAPALYPDHAVRVLIHSWRMHGGRSFLSYWSRLLTRC